MSYRRGVLRPARPKDGGLAMHISSFIFDELGERLPLPGPRFTEEELREMVADELTSAEAFREFRRDHPEYFTGWLELPTTKEHLLAHHYTGVGDG